MQCALNVVLFTLWAFSAPLHFLQDLGKMAGFLSFQGTLVLYPITEAEVVYFADGGRGLILRNADGLWKLEKEEH